MKIQPVGDSKVQIGPTVKQSGLDTNAIFIQVLTEETTLPPAEIQRIASIVKQRIIDAANQGVGQTHTSRLFEETGGYDKPGQRNPY